MKSLRKLGSFILAVVLLFSIMPQVGAETQGKNVVNYYANGATEGKAPSDANLYAVGALVTVKGSQGMAKEGWIFDSWNTQEDGQGRTYNEGDRFRINGKVGLYAKWVGDGEIGKHYSYINGYPDSSFKSQGNITRAEFAQVLYNLYKNGESFPVLNKTVTKHFSDVKQGTWYYDAVMKMAEADIISGYPEGDFKPDDYITRAEAAKLVANAKNLAPSTSGSSFPDVKEGHWAAKSIQSCADYGYINGYEDGSFQADRNITRSEIAKIINKVLGRLADGAQDKGDLSDLNSKHWAYKDILEATTSHIFEKGINGQETWLSFYRVKYNSNGAGCSMPRDIEPYQKGEVATILNGSDSSYGKFLGWNSQADGKGKNYAAGDKITVAEEDIVLYAQWDRSEIEGREIAQVAILPNVDVEEGTTLDQLELPDRVNVTLKSGERKQLELEWDTTNYKSEPGKYRLTASLKLPEDGSAVNSGNHNAAVLVTVYEDDGSYKIKIDTAGGGSVYTRIVAAGGKLTEPETPKREGYSFEGWYLNDKKYDFDAEVNSDFTLTAKWVRIFEVKFDSDGGSVVAGQKIREGELVKRPTDPEKENLVLEGWKLNGKIYDFDTPVTADITLTASWVVHTHRVSFDSDGGSSIKDVMVYHNNMLNAPQDPSRLGHSFLGWYRDGSLYDFKTPVTEDLELKASWIKKSYEVSFDSNGGSAVSSQQVYYRDKASVPQNPTRVGYTFARWMLGNIPYNFDIPVAVDTKLTAKWDINKYKIHYIANGGKDPDGGVGMGPMDENEYPYESMAPVSFNHQLTVQGKVFLGWSRDRSASTAEFMHGAVESFQITEDTILYAIWGDGKASIGDKQYGSLASALAVSRSGNTVTMIDNCVEGNIKIPSGVTVKIPTGLKLTVSSFTGEKYSDSFFELEAGSKISFMNGAELRMVNSGKLSLPAGATFTQDTRMNFLWVDEIASWQQIQYEG